MSLAAFSQLVALEGNIGAGKSTLAQSCIDDPSARAQADFETISDELKALFYADPKANAFGMEMATGMRRSNMLHFYASRIKKNTKASLLLERSLVGSFAFCAVSFARGALNERQYAALTKECGSTKSCIDAALSHALRSSSSARRPLIVVHMRADPAQCLQNVHQRGAADAKSITLEYLYQVNAAHELAFLQLYATATRDSRYDLVTLSWNEYKSASPARILALVRKRAAAWRSDLVNNLLPTLVSDTQLTRAREALERVDDPEVRSRLVSALLTNTPALARALL